MLNELNMNEQPMVLQIFERLLNISFKLIIVMEKNEGGVLIRKQHVLVSGSGFFSLRGKVYPDKTIRCIF